MSVRWRPSCRTHSEPLLKIRHRTLQHFLRHSCDFLTNGKFQLFDNARSVRVRSTLQVSPQKKKCHTLIDQGNMGAKKHHWNGRSHVGGTAQWQTHDALRSNVPWLLKLHCLSCPPAHTQRHQLHPCRVLAIWKTCVSPAPPCIFIHIYIYICIFVVYYHIIMSGLSMGTVLSVCACWFHNMVTLPSWLVFGTWSHLCLLSNFIPISFHMLKV